MESDQSNKRQRLGSPGGDGDSRKAGGLRRDEADFDVGASWKTLVLRLGERSAEFQGRVEAEEQIELSASVLLRNWDGIKGDFLPLLMQCMEELPTKAPFYATLVGLLNTSQQLLGRAVVDHVFSGLQAGLETGECNKVRLLLRVLTLLMCNNVVTPATVLAAYMELLTAALATPLQVGKEEGGDAPMAENGTSQSPSARLRAPVVSPNQPRADFLVFCVLAALPFGAPELHKSCGAELEKVLSAAEGYMAARAPLRLPALAPLAASSEPAVAEVSPTDYLEDLWARVTALRKDAWETSAVPRPQQAFLDQLFLAEGEQQQHAGTPLTIPSADFVPANPDDPVACGRAFFAALEAFPPRVTLFRLFPAARTDDVLAPIDRFLVQEYIVDILFYLNGCRKECTAYLVQLPVPFRYEYVMAETIFSQLLLLPRPPFPLVAYTLILVDLCKALPAAFPAVLASAVRLLFSRMPLLDVECRCRIVQWMAHHLSNFAFVWPWDAWAAVARQPEWSPQRVFAAEVLEKEVRLAYLKKVKESIQSEAMEELLPGATGPFFAYGHARRLGNKDSAAEKGGKGQGEQPLGEGGEQAAGASEARGPGEDTARANGATARGEGADAPGAAVSEQERQVAQQLMELVRKKTPARDVTAWVDQLLLEASGVPREKAVDIVVQTLLMLGSKSITHSSTLLERYLPAIQKLAPSQALQVAVVASVVRLWRDSPQMAAILVDRCMTLRIVSNLAIVDWVFTRDNLPLFHSSDRVWEILRGAIAKTAHRVQDLVRDVAALRRAAAEADASASRARAEAEELAEASAASSGAAAQLAPRLALAQEHAVQAEAECTSAHEAVEAKEALLLRAQKEQEALFSATLSRFSEAVGARLGVDGAEDKEMEESTGQEDVQDEEGRGVTRKKKTKLEEVEEKEWLRCTLGTLRSICRHYASQVWPMMGSLNNALLPSLRPSIVRSIEEGLLVPTTC